MPRVVGIDHLVLSVGDFARFTANAPQAADLVLDLCGAGRRSGERTWQLTFDTAPSESTAIGALICRRTPVVAIVDLETGAELISRLDIELGDSI